MTTTAAATSTTTADRRSMTQYGVAAWLLAVVTTAVANFTDVVANDSADPTLRDVWVWLGTIAVLAVIAFPVYRFWYAPAAAAPAAPNTALVGGVLAFLAFPAFWTGLPIVLGVGAIVLALRTRGAKAYVGLALAAVGIALTVFAAVFG